MIHIRKTRRSEPLGYTLGLWSKASKFERPQTSCISDFTIAYDWPLYLAHVFVETSIHAMAYHYHIFMNIPYVYIYICYI